MAENQSSSQGVQKAAIPGSGRNRMPDGKMLNAHDSSRSNIILAVGLVIVLATLIIPLPTFMLDTLLACSISLAIAVLIITLSSKEALEVWTFPALLLFVTLFRLSLNVASTRLILLNGFAGQIIQTFGDFV
ncbi:MAG: FHIPEP family type III secretion protein, partial [Planctomycetota bacterium]